MSADTLTPASEIAQHPYITNDAADSRFANFVNTDDYDRMHLFLWDVIDSHASNKIDLLVGDDVSGRVPTLLARYFLQLAHTGGQIDTVPQAIFMPSGTIPSSANDRRAVDVQWRGNLRERTTHIMDVISPKRVAVITETVASGESLVRLKAPFLEQNNVDVQHFNARLVSLYFRGEGRKGKLRPAVGVEKYPPDATSKKHPKFDAAKVAALRYFLKDYAAAVYANTFSDEVLASGYNLTESKKPNPNVTPQVVSVDDRFEDVEEMNGIKRFFARLFYSGAI